ncbi:MAG: FHA domain-containing protein, partial [Cyanothece sp. SIO2G6]|nr:FHA domain-containing protein [Cyanothece sp. SIO2G6]
CHSWYIVNLGTNGTYFEGKRIEKMPVQDGMTIRLARSGPILRVHLGPHPPLDANSVPLTPNSPRSPLADEATKPQSSLRPIHRGLRTGMME